MAILLYMSHDEKDRRTEQMRQVCEDVIKFKSSPLYKERIKNKVYPVCGEGSHKAKIMFIGEAPGKTEAETGRPFAGAAGKILDGLLSSVGIPRGDVYITNVVKDRPPMNRDPLPEEISLYAPFLDRQIEIIQPKVIALLGRHSMYYVMEKFGLYDKLESISRIHGQAFEAEASYGKIMIVPFYHPAAALYNPDLRKSLLEDFKILQKLQ